ncbi:MAG: GTPase RsgA, partial [Eubacteriales bacterium]
MQINGLILKGIGGFYYVEAADEIFECRARGIFRKEKLTPLPGDHVLITIRQNDENTIDSILPRSNSFLRPPIANVDQLIIVASICEPNPSTLIIDKLSAIAQSKDIETIVIVTKADIADTSELVEIYKKAGLKVFSVSCITGEGVEQVRKSLEGHISAFTGNSG